MENHRFILEKYKGTGTRYSCPACNSKYEFAKYIDTENRYTFPDHVGRCNRESSCGYHYTPKQFFDDNSDERTSANNGQTKVLNNPQVAHQYDYFDKKTVLATMQAYERNSFVNALRLIFDNEQINNIINCYGLGTTRSGGAIFWQVDTLGRVRYGKAIHYLPDLHRDKSKHPVGVHSLMGKHDFNHRQCFFGEHLLSLPENKDRAVAIIESEKSACICSEVLPAYVWLATGGKSGIKWTDKNAWVNLQGRKVILFPDVDAHSQWAEKAVLFRNFGIDISVYNGLARVAWGTQQDIADHIIIDLMQRKHLNNSVVTSMVDEVIETKPTRILSGDELMKLATGLPDNNSFTESELCRMLNVEPTHVSDLIDRKQIYFITQTGKYCRSGCTPF